MKNLIVFIAMMAIFSCQTEVFGQERQEKKWIYEGEYAVGEDTIKTIMPPGTRFSLYYLNEFRVVEKITYIKVKLVYVKCISLLVVAISDLGEVAIIYNATLDWQHNNNAILNKFLKEWPELNLDEALKWSMPENGTLGQKAYELLTKK